MFATVAIPWRPEPQRLAPYERVRKFWAYAGLPVVTADSDRRKPFNLAAARNKAVRKVKTDVVILCDADSVPDLRSVLAAVADPAGMTLPFSLYRTIPAEWAERPDLLAAPTLLSSKMSTGGCWVITTANYWRVGGCDERFTTWGGEDVSFYFAAEIFVGARRTNGTIHAFHNDRDRDTEKVNPLLDQYYAARGSRWKMTELFRRRDAEALEAAHV